MDTYGQRLREARSNAGLTLLQLGRLVGVTKSGLSQIEHDVLYPSPDLATRIKQQLGLAAPSQRPKAVPSPRTPSPNTYAIDREIAILDLTQDQATQIDVADLALALTFRWHAAWDNGKQGYYVCSQCYDGGKEVRLHLHRLLLDAPATYEVDHINGDPLDNRRFNLRLVTGKQNQQNRVGALRVNAVGIRGVRFQRTRNRYYVSVCADGKTHFGGRFPATPEGLQEAERAAIALRHKLFTHSDGR